MEDKNMGDSKKIVRFKNDIVEIPGLRIQLQISDEIVILQVVGIVGFEHMVINLVEVSAREFGDYTIDSLFDYIVDTISFIDNDEEFIISLKDDNCNYEIKIVITDDGYEITSPQIDGVLNIQHGDNQVRVTEGYFTKSHKRNVIRDIVYNYNDHCDLVSIEKID